ncbi:MAG TPA: phenol hydroxylase subunit [Patescibacteria group bacterium]|nr:phenol hydroxylase subunit [Patescibacteria group bacterium]
MADLLTSYACVKTIRHGKFVEFDFSINDNDLSVELIMPFGAFEEFCRMRNAIVTYPDGAASPETVGVSQPALPAGLYRPPHQHSVPNE